MWLFFRRTPNLITAEMWKELLENQGVPVHMHIAPEHLGMGDQAPRILMVPKEKRRIAEEVIKETFFH